VSIRALRCSLLLCAIGCADLSPSAGPTTDATIVIARSSLSPSAVAADSVHAVIARVSGAVVAEAGAPFAGDTVAITFPLVLLDEIERFRLTLTYFQDGRDIRTETIAFAVERDGSVQVIPLKPREWTSTEGTQPGPREGAAMAYIPGLGGALLSGGLDANGDTLNDAWLYDGTGWRELPPMPDFRRYHVIVPLGADSALVVGGLPPSVSPGLWIRTLVYDGVQWSALAGPVTRDRSAVAFDLERRQLVLFGGTPADPLQRGTTTWVRNVFPQQPFWRELDGPGPSARVGHVMVYDPDRRAVVLFGGTGLDGVELNDVWVWNGEEDGWSGFETFGDWPARSGHTAFHDPGRGAIVVVGGERDGEFLDDIWELRGDSWSVLTGVRPAPRVGLGAFLNSLDVGVMVSGRGPSGLVTDWWTYR
jgi:hypothetical protein